MEKYINTIITESREALKEAILSENKVIEEKLLNILTNIRFLEKELKENLTIKKVKKKSKEELEELEIIKVKRRIPQWNEKRNQYNYRILKAFMDLSNHGNHSVNIISLERYLNLNDPKKFLGHYNQLKTISAKNHGKVFSENDGQIELWEPVKEYIIENFESKNTHN